MPDDNVIAYARARMDVLPDDVQLEVQALIAKIADYEAQASVLDAERTALKERANALARLTADCYDELRGMLPTNPIEPIRLG